MTGVTKSNAFNPIFLGGWVNWPSLFFDQTELPGIATGPGTLWPLPSMPIAQAARYYWSVKKWRFQFSLGDSAGDSDFIPYGTGKQLDNGVLTVLPRTWGIGDKTKEATLAERVLGDSNTIQSGIGNGFSKFVGDSLNSTSGAVGATLLLPPFIFDASIPGNVFMTLILTGGAGTIVAGLSTFSASATSLSSSGSLSACVATLDGQSISMYDNPGGSLTGTIAITTQSH